jgi:hypothetical protein
MLQKLRPRSIYDVMAAIGCFAALAGGTAYAANEWTGANIVDESLTGADIKNGSLSGGEVTNNTVSGADVTNESLTTSDIKNFSLGNGDFLTGSVDSRAAADNSLTSADILNFSLGNGDLLTGSVDSRAATDNSLTSTDIDESTLNMPPTTTATFAGPSGSVPLDDFFTKVAAKTLPAGSYAVIATANTETGAPFGGGDRITDTACELRNGSNFIGGATDRRVVKNLDQGKAALSMNGGAQVPAGGGEVSLWCLSQLGGIVRSGQMMMIRLDGFF